jgi:hypothetical protein
MDTKPVSRKTSENPDEKPQANANANAKENTSPGKKIIPPPPPQSPIRKFVDRKVTVIMQILGLI